jgi:basic membrane lipoprotein Med (substrate-binding protein (PBP1-ABC) superfamily)
MRTLLLSLAFVALVAMPVSAASEAEQCDMAATQIDKEYGKRFDKKAAEVRSMEAQARSLQKQGKHAEALKVYEAAAKSGDIHLMHAK